MNPFPPEMINQIAAFICNRKHSGIDVWSMYGEQEDRKDYWRAEALYFARGIAVAIDQSRPPFDPICKLPMGGTDNAD